ncbi:MAG: hypothetical protein WD004_03175 [Actinomycetota bacterium]
MTGTDASAGTGSRDVAGAQKPFGPVAAVFIAAGIGSLVLGILTMAAEASASIKSMLEWSKAVGPLMGKTLVSSAAFFISWGVLHAAWKSKDPEPRKVWIWTSVLVLLGLLGTFPIFFQLFAGE